MEPTPSISVVIPCHNEEESIAAVIRAVPNTVLEILVIDNNSTDRTAEIARAAGARVIAEPMQGYGPAIACGFRHARGDIIVTFDGDNQYPAELIGDIVDYLLAHELDFISASRFPLIDKNAMPLTRRIGNWGLTLATNVLLNLRLHDSQSGMWVFRREVLDRFVLTEATHTQGMLLSQEIKVRAFTDLHLRAAEYHIPYRPRRGASKLLPLTDGWRTLVFICKLWLHGNRRK